MTNPPIVVGVGFVGAYYLWDFFYSAMTSSGQGERAKTTPEKYRTTNYYRKIG